MFHRTELPPNPLRPASHAGFLMSKKNTDDIGEALFGALVPKSSLCVMAADSWSPLYLIYLFLDSKANRTCVSYQRQL